MGGLRAGRTWFAGTRPPGGSQLCAPGVPRRGLGLRRSSGCETEGGVMCGNRRTCLGRVRSGRVGPGTEPRGTPTPKAWAEEEENQGRQCCDARRVAVGGQWEDLRPQCGFTLE